MPLAMDLSPEEDKSKLPLDLQTEPVSPYSPKQESKNALSAALAEDNLRSDEGGVDVGGTFATNKDNIKNGNEQALRNNISALEQQKTISGAKNGFSQAILLGDNGLALGFAGVAQEATQNLKPDAVEFNALDKFRQDYPEADSNLQDNTQAVLASSMIANSNNDKEVTSGVLDTINETYRNLQKSANENGNSLKTDVLKGIVNGVPTVAQGVAENIGTLFPSIPNAAQSYLKDNLKTDASGNPINVDQMMEGLHKDLSNMKFKVGTTGKTVESMSAFAVAIGTVFSKLPIAAGAGLNFARTTAGVVIADASILQGMDSAANHFVEAFPSTKNAVFSWLGDRRKDSPWENKARQAIEAAVGNTVGEAAFKVAGKFFNVLKSIKDYKSTKASNAVMEKVAENPATTAAVMGDHATGGSLAQQKLSNNPDLSPIISDSMSTNDAIEATIPSIMKTPLDPKPEIGLMGMVDVNEVRAKTLERAKLLAEKSHQVARITDSELTPAIDDLAENIQGNYSKHKVLDVAIGKDANGTNITTVTLGQNGTGLGWTSEEIARNQTFGMNVDILAQPNGLFYATHSKAISEIGLTEAIDFSSSSMLMKVPGLRNALDMSSYLPQTLVQDIGLATNSRTTLKKTFINPLMKQYLKDVSKEEFGHVNTIAALGRDAVVDESGRTGRWFSKDEFNIHYKNLSGKETTPDNVYKSYQAYREINDWHYAVENSVEVARKDKMGMVELFTDTPDFSFRGNVIVKDTLQANDSFRVYVPSENKVLNKGEITASELSAKYQDYKIIQVEDAHQLESGEAVKYMLMHQDNFVTNMVDRIQVPYRAGGRVEYAGKYKYFSKQAVTSTDVNGNVINHNPLTHYVSQSRQELVLHTQALENARNAYRSAMEYGTDGGQITYKEVNGIKKDGTFTYSKTGKVLSAKEADAIISKTALVNTENMAIHVENKGINLEHPFEVRNDKELPVAYNTSNASYIDENHSGSTTWLMTNKKTKFRGRGERLLSPNELDAEVLSPHEAIEKSINSIINHGVAGNYTTRIAEQFTATAKAHNFLKPEFRDASPAKIFSEGTNAIQPSITGLADPDYQSLLTTLNSMQKALGYRSNAAKWKDAQIKSAIEYYESNAGSLLAPSTVKEFKVGDKTILKSTKLSRRTITDAMISFSHADPLQAANTFQYYSNFALKAAQFAMQAGSGYLETAKLHPVKATQALMGVATHANYFFREDISHAQKFNKPLMNLLGYKDGDAFISYLEHLKKSGYINVLDTHVDLARRKMVTGKHGTAFDLIDKGISKSTLAMETGEMINQMILHRTAYMKFEEQFPKLNIDSPSSAAWIIREADRLGYDMKSAIQRDVSKNIITAPLLRYKNFFVKVLEHNTIGGSRTLEEKAKYWTATAALTGFGFNETTHYWEQKFGLDKKGQSNVENGFLGWMTTNQQGDGAVDVSNLFSVGGGISSIVDLVTTGEAFNYLQTPLGQILSKVKDKAWNSALFLSQLGSKDATTNIQISQNALIEASKIASFMSPATRGSVALETGKLYSEKGALITEGISNTAAIATMLGFKSTDEIKYGYNVGLMKDRKTENTERADAVYYALQKSKMVDRSTRAGEAEFNSWIDLSLHFSNNPDKSEILKLVNTKERYSEQGLSSTTRKIKQQDLAREAFKEINK